MHVAPPRSLNDLRRLMPFAIHTAEQRIEFIEPPADLDFDRPFWHMTIEELKAKHKLGELTTVSVGFDDLHALAAPAAPEPSGMIFHIGRCGSTLVSRMVGHDRSQLVLRECDVIGGLHRATSGSDLVPTFTLERALRDTLVAFDQFAQERGQKVIVKHSSWESFSMTRIAEILPGVPFVFVFRDPVATVESSLDGHPGWAPRIHQPRQYLQRWVPWVEQVPGPWNAATIYASVWASGADAALRLPSERVLLIDHAELLADPEQQLALLVKHLGLMLDRDEALAELDHYSKAKSDGTAFDPKGSHAHPSLSARTQAQVREVVGDLPARLAERLTAQKSILDSNLRSTKL